MNEKLRTQRSTPSRLNAVGPMKKIGVSFVRKNVRISDMLRSVRRGDATGLSGASGVAAVASVGASLVARATASAPSTGSAMV